MFLVTGPCWSVGRDHEGRPNVCRQHFFLYDASTARTAVGRPSQNHEIAMYTGWANARRRHDILLLPMARVHALSTPGRRQILHTRNGAVDVVVESECLLVVRPLGPSSYVVPCV